MRPSFTDVIPAWRARPVGFPRRVCTRFGFILNSADSDYTLGEWLRKRNFYISARFFCLGIFSLTPWKSAVSRGIRKATPSTRNCSKQLFAA
jgi:hypothetical protein